MFVCFKNKNKKLYIYIYMVHTYHKYLYVVNIVHTESIAMTKTIYNIICSCPQNLALLSLVTFGGLRCTTSRWTMSLATTGLDSWDWGSDGQVVYWTLLKKARPWWSVWHILCVTYVWRTTLVFWVQMSLTMIYDGLKVGRTIFCPTENWAMVTVTQTEHAKSPHITTGAPNCEVWHSLIFLGVQQCIWVFLMVSMPNSMIILWSLGRAPPCSVWEPVGATKSFPTTE